MRLVLCMCNLEKAPEMPKTRHFRTGMRLCKSGISAIEPHERKGNLQNDAAELAAMPKFQRLSHQSPHPKQTLLPFWATAHSQAEGRGALLFLCAELTLHMCAWCLHPGGFLLMTAPLRPALLSLPPCTWMLHTPCAS